MMSEELGKAVRLIANIHDLAHVVLSGRRRNYTVDYPRIDIRPVDIKSKLHYQLTYSDGKKITTKNVEEGKLDIQTLLESGYSNITIRHRNGEYVARFTKRDEILESEKPGHFEADTRHDRNKERLLSARDPFLTLVGISDSDGVVKPSKMAKYKQIEEFLRLVTPEIMKLPEPISIVDLGAGSGYLTFAIHQAPCCQHDIQKQMKVSPEPWSAITSHGILKERLGDLITDALRIEILKSKGYRCDAIEFIGGEHTPRNVMIRAIYTGQISSLERYEQLKSQWGVTSALHRALTNR